ncbi:MAG TPA: hypothetical protein VGD91_11520 [Trebonia sp.]
MQQRNRDPGPVRLTVELVYQGAADAAAALTRRDEHQHQVGGGSQPGHRRDPARRLRPLRGQHRHRGAVALGQPGPGVRPGQQARRLVPQCRQRGRPLGDVPEARVPPDNLESEPGHGLRVGRPGPADDQRSRRAEPGTVRAGGRGGRGRRGRRGRPARRGPGRQHLERGQAVPQQRGDPAGVAARPVDHRRGVRVPGSGHPGQVVAPPRQQLGERAGHVGIRDRRGQLEPAGGPPGQVEGAGFAGPVLAPADGRRGGRSADDQRCPAVRSGGSGRRQQRVDLPPAPRHPPGDAAGRVS